jgi:hypothetical protein
MIVRHGQRKSLSFIFHEHIVYLHEKTKLTSNFFFCPLAEGVGFDLEEAGSGFTVTPAWFIRECVKIMPLRQKPPDVPVSSEGFLEGHRLSKDSVFIYPVELSNLISSHPSLLIESADGGHNRQEEQTEHEIGCRAQPLIQQMSKVEEQERCEDNGESPGAQHQDVSVLVHLLKRVSMGRLCRHDLFLLS